MSLKEISIISGKGGTGKTSLVASIIPFLPEVVIADADVDAPDLKILLANTLVSEEDFVGLKRAKIDYDKCIHCGLCHEVCKFDAISEDIVVNEGKCEGCTVCKVACPVGAITMEDYIVGKVFTRNSTYGPMVDARLIPGEEASGRLVSKVRQLAKDIAEEQEKDYILLDGSPGIACNVISAITGADKVVVVTEPTLSGLHDLQRVLDLAKTFSIEPVVVINKCGIETSMEEQIKDYCSSNQIPVMLEIPFDKAMVTSIANKEIPSLTDIPYFKGEEWEKFIAYLKE